MGGRGVLSGVFVGGGVVGAGDWVIGRLEEGLVSDAWQAERVKSRMSVHTRNPKCCFMI